MLWIALELPSLPLQLAQRASPSPSPLVIADGPAQRPIVLCANAAAKAAGIREGQAVAAAKVLVGQLKSLARDPAAEQAALEGLAGWATQFTPAAGVDGQGIALEVQASVRIFGGHARLTAALAQGVRDLGYEATLGIAPTPMAARLFARAEAQGRRVRACLALEELPERVGDLPLFLLDWPSHTLALLTDLGVLRLRDALALPREGLARRFGPDVVDDLDRLTGRRPDPRQAYVAPARFHVRLELPAETASTQALLFPLRRLLVQMEGFLRGRGCGVQELALTLEPLRGPSTRLALAFASPEREAEFILSMAREKLGRTRLVAPALVIELEAQVLLPYAPRPQAWLPGRAEQAIDRERLLERLSARLGKDRVFGIALADDHRPERGWGKGVGVIYSPSKVPGRGINDSDPFSANARPTWLLLRPQRLVTQDGQPACQGKLQLCAGPERIEAGWWDGAPVARDYFIATNPAGEALWVYREHREPAAWYLHGLFA